VTSCSKIRDVQRGDLVFDVMRGLQPVIGSYDATTASIANQAPHPNAAKLMIRWYMGDKEGGKGLKPLPRPWRSATA
jgi:iron(III) transport system substrate-binding protein